MVSLCGRCRYELGAARRWTVVPKVESKAPVRTKAFHVAPAPPRAPVCSGCHLAPLSDNYPHALFDATAEEIARVRAELAAAASSETTTGTA